MSRYRNRPDRRVIRETPIQIQPVLNYTATNPSPSTIDLTFSEQVFKTGPLIVRVANASGALLGGTLTVTQFNSTTIRVQGTLSFPDTGMIVFIEQNQLTLRSASGAIASAAPRFILGS